MIFQTTNGIRPEVAECGCYYMSILWHAARLDPEAHFLTVHDINHTIYDKLTGEGWMGQDCDISDPEAIFRWLGFDVRYKGHLPADRVCADGEIEILKFELPSRGWTHFVAGNGIGFTTYDPWGVSETAARGRLHSKRIFEVVG